MLGFLKKFKRPEFSKRFERPKFSRFSNFSPGLLLHNKIFIGSVIMIFSVIVGFVIVPIFNANTRKTVKVYRAKVTIYEYQQVTKDMVQQVEVGSYGLSNQTIKDLSNVVGKTARTKIVEGDNILSGQLMTGNNDDEFLSELSKQSKRAVSVTLPTLSASVSGQIISGDVVSVITYVKQTSASSSSSSSSSKGNSFNNGITGNTGSAATDETPVLYPNLKYIQVAAIYDKSGDPVTDLSKAKNTDGESSKLPSTVTFICTEQQALELAQIDKKGDMYLVFVARGQEADSLIKQQDSIKSSSASSSSTNPDSSHVTTSSSTYKSS